MKRKTIIVLFVSWFVAFETGVASWYGPGFHGRRTANGERYNMNAMTAAHKRLPFGTRLLVGYEETGKFVTVRINDRGPFIKERTLDLSRKAAQELGICSRGTGIVMYAIMEDL